MARMGIVELCSTPVLVMKTEQVLQIFGLLVNAGLAMSTLVVFLIVRCFIYKNRTRAIDAEVYIEEGQMILKISNRLPVSVFVTSLIWNVGMIFKNRFIYRRPSAENLEIPPKGVIQLVLQEDELKALRQFLVRFLERWSTFFVQRGLEVGTCISGKQEIYYYSLRYDVIRNLLMDQRLP